ncbi:MAG: class II aldolase/adducin family protein [Burkholderiaceae bacterium]
MKSDPAIASVGSQTEQQTRLEMVSACITLSEKGLSPVGFISMGHRWARSGAQGVLCTPTSPAQPVDTWTADDLQWHSRTAAAADTAPWPGQQPDDAIPTNTSWLGVFRGLLEENNAVRTILLISPPYASALACLPRVHSEGLLPVHPAVAAFSPDGVPCAPFVATGNHSLDQQSLEAILPALALGQACLLANQGVLVTGHSIRQTIYRAQCLEGLARLYGLALQMGEPAILDADQLNLGFAHWQQPV